LSGTSALIYLDESGDLGWKFDAPYRRGGSSRYLTISALCVPADKKHLPKRIVKDLYSKFKWPTGEERKWSVMTPEERLYFASRARDLSAKHPEIVLHAIVVRKQNVMPHIRNDANKLYNYMTRLALLDRMAQYDVVTMVPDPRSIRVKSGNSLHDYLQTELWFTKKAATNLITRPSDSATSLAVQFADMLAGAVQSRFEDNSTHVFQLIQPHLKLVQLYF
jgi:hypothetical protein